MASDQELLQSYISTRNGEAFAELVQRYAPMVYATCLRVLHNRADAEDAAQECLLQLARTPDAVERNLGGWLYRTARNKALEHMRSAAVRREHEHAAVPPEKSEAGAAEVDEVIGTLGNDLREPLVLHFLRGLTQAQVAAELQLSQPTVSRRIEQALELLRSRLQTAGTAAAPAMVLGSPAFVGDAQIAGQIALRVVAVVNSVHSASAATVAGGAAKMSVIAKGIAAGLLLTAIGAGIVAAVGVGKRNPPAAIPPRPVTAAAVQPASAPVSGWKVEGQKVTIDGLGTAELVGICTDETDPPTWWGPDGKELEVVPLTRTSVPMPDQWPNRLCRRFAVQVSGPLATRWYFWDFQPVYGSRWSGNPPINGFIPRLDIKEAQAGFTEGVNTVTVRYGIASAKLETMLEADNRGKLLSGGEHVRINRVRPDGQTTIVHFTVDGGEDPRVVVTSFAVTPDGRWIERSNSNRNPHGPVDYEQTYPLPQDQIQKLVIQCRRYTHWITWKNVPLQPGAGAATTASVEGIATP